MKDFNGELSQKIVEAIINEKSVREQIDFFTKVLKSSSTSMMDRVTAAKTLQKICSPEEQVAILHR